MSTGRAHPSREGHGAWATGRDAATEPCRVRRPARPRAATSGRVRRVVMRDARGVRRGIRSGYRFGTAGRRRTYAAHRRPSGTDTLFHIRRRTPHAVAGRLAARRVAASAVTDAARRIGRQAPYAARPVAVNPALAVSIAPPSELNVPPSLCTDIPPPGGTPPPPHTPPPAASPPRCPTPRRSPSPPRRSPAPSPASRSRPIRQPRPARIDPSPHAA